MGLHHSTLKAAVSKYEGLVAEGKTEEEVKAEIAKDEKGYNSDAVNEIYSAMTEENQDTPPAKSEAKVYIVTSPFQDKFDNETWYKPGTDVSHFDADRLADLENREMIKAE